MQRDEPIPDQISIQEAQGNLKNLIAGLDPGAELVMTDHERPVAKLVAEAAKPSGKTVERQDGQLKGQIAIAASFDELPVTSNHAWAVGLLPNHHRDPFD